MSEHLLPQLRELARKAAPNTEQVFKKWKKQPPRDFDVTVQDIHHDVFDQTDCLACANCCKTTSPVFYERDIERIAKYLKIKPSQFVAQYLHIDADSDYVLNHAPCPFLNADNTCAVYAHRPTACREYPHTDRKRFHQILDLTLRNTYVCPAAYQVVERLKQALSQ